MNLNDATALSGYLSFGMAALVCFWAWRGMRGLWGGLTVIHLIFFIEIIVGSRHQFSEVLRGVFRGSAFYEQRTGLPSVFILSLLVCTLIFLCWWLIQRVTARSEKIALLSSLGIVFLFVLEVVSLHYVDAWLYRAAGSVYLIAWFWGAGCLLTSLAAFSCWRGPNK